MRGKAACWEKVKRFDFLWAVLIPESVLSCRNVLFLGATQAQAQCVSRQVRTCCDGVVWAFVGSHVRYSSTGVKGKKNPANTVWSAESHVLWGHLSGWCVCFCVWVCLFAKFNKSQLAKINHSCRVLSHWTSLAQMNFGLVLKLSVKLWCGSQSCSRCPLVWFDCREKRNHRSLLIDTFRFDYNTKHLFGRAEDSILGLKLDTNLKLNFIIVRFESTNKTF